MIVAKAPDYSTAGDIAAKVFADLNLPDDIYLSWTREDVANFEKEYIQDAFIQPKVEAELANYDTSNCTDSEIQDIVEDAVSDVEFSLATLVDNFWENQHQITLNSYHEIVQTLQNAALSGVVDIDTEYEPADPDVGIFTEERRIVFTLENGSYITFNVEIEED